MLLLLIWHFCLYDNLIWIYKLTLEQLEKKDFATRPRGTVFVKCDKQKRVEHSIGTVDSRLTYSMKEA